MDDVEDDKLQPTHVYTKYFDMWECGGMCEYMYLIQ